MIHECETCGSPLKTCCRCSESKPVTLFYRSKRSKDGFCGHCKACQVLAVKISRLKYPEKVAIYQARYSASPAGKARRARYRKRNPEQARAGRAVASAIARGDLVRPLVCSREGCDNGGLIDGHHESYEKEHWLDVEWLCRICHGLLKIGQSELAEATL